MRSISKNKRGSVQELPGFFQVMMLVVVFAGLTFIVLDKFLDASVSDSLTTRTVTNESGGYINSTGFTLAQAGALEFTNPVIIAAWNATNGTAGYPVLIPVGNYTVSAAGVVTNATTYNWQVVNFTYSYDSIVGINAYKVINESTYDLYDYGVGFLGIIILVTMVYLIIRIVSGSGRKR